MDLISNFLKSIWRFNPIGSLATNIQHLAEYDYKNGSFGNFVSSLFGRYFGNQNLVGEIDKNVDSLVASETGSAPTEKDIWQAEREDSTHQRTVDDMVKAGLNPALMYGGSGQTVGSSAGNSNPSGIGDLLQIAMMPLQMQNLKAQNDNLRAAAGKTREETRWIGIMNDVEKRSKESGIELNRSRILEIEQNIDTAKADMAKKLQEAKSEEVRQELMNTEMILNRASANRIARLLPFEEMQIQASTDEQIAQAEYLTVKTAYEQALLSSDYINNIIIQQRANTTVAEVEAYLSSDQYGREDESGLQKVVHSLVAGVNTAIKIVSPIKSFSSSTNVNNNMSLSRSYNRNESRNVSHIYSYKFN